MRESQTGIPLQVEPGGTNAFDFVTLSQESWRHLKRGLISRPQEIPGLSGLLDRSIKNVFSKYIDSARPPPVVVWSLLTDEPLESNECHFDYRRPEGITEEDELNYYIGIHQLNDWGTDLAARYWISHSSKHSIVRKTGEIYSDICINNGQKIFYKHAYEIMEQVKASAGEHGQNIEDAIFKALFQHDFRDIDIVVLQAKIADCQTLNQLALHLGKSLPKINETRISRSLNMHEKDSDIKRLSKRTILSMLKYGNHSQPGIVEIIVMQPAAVLISGVITLSVFTDIFTRIAAGTLGGIVITGLPYGYVLFHETVHDYQTDCKFNGFIPLTLTSIGKHVINR